VIAASRQDLDVQKRGTVRRWLLVIAGLIAAGTSTAAWLLRDPVPRMRARHGTLAEARTEPVDSAGAYVNERVVVRSSSGLRSEMLLRRPARVDARSAVRRLPVFLILGGHESQERAATLIEDPGDNIVVALAYPFDGNPRVKGLAVVPLVPRIRKALLDTPPAVMLAIDYLRARPDVDSTRIELVGASFGAPFAAMTAALDTRVSRLWLVHGAGEPYTLLEHNLQSSISWKVPRAMVAALANVLAAGPRFAPERWVPLVSPRPVIMINATEDERLPRASIETLHNSAREPKEVIWFPGMHIRSNRRAIIEGLVKIVLERSAMPARAGS
jgi:hypothetical protein